MDKKAYNLRFLLSIFLTVLFLSSSCFSVLAKPAGKAPIEDFEISDEEEEEEEVEEAGDKSKAAAPKKNNDEEAEAEEEEEEDEEGDEDEDDEESNLTPEQKAAKKAAAKAAREALEKKVIELENKVRELGKDNSAIKGLLTDEANINAVNESGFLLEKLIEASLSDKNPNYTEIKTYGEKLQGKNINLSLAYYAQGMGYMYAKKPNLAKAMDLFGKAKKEKKPYKDASSAYTTCLLKRFGLYIVLGVLLVVGLIVAFIVKKIKAKKAANANADNTAEANAEGAPDIDLQKLLDTPVEDSSANNENKVSDISALSNAGDTGNETKQVNEPDNIPLTQQQKPEPTKANTVATNNTSNASLPNQTENLNKDINKPAANQEQPLAIANNTNEASANTAATSSAPTKKVVRVVKKVRVRKDANGNSYVVSQGSSIQSDAIKEDDQNSEIAKLEREKIRNIARPIDKPLPPVDTQLDILWGNLSRKAMQGHIGLLARKSDAISSSLGSSVTSNNSSYGGYSSDNRVTDFRLGDVSIDLSEEALKDDLVGKLKMLAITDAELRELFAMKNPAHIPHLIEYIMTKPEPMRLAFIAKELGNYADPAVVDALSSLLYNEDERVVLAAIQGLEATKLPAAVVPLCPFLKSDIPLYAQAARTALSKFGAVKIMQALKDLPTFTDLKLKEAGIFVLSRMKGEPVEKILKSLLNDESTSVRIQTILAMSYQKNPVYIDPLREFYRIANETEKSMTRKAIVYLNGFNK